MASKLRAIALASSVLALAASACGPPKQAEVADVDKDTGIDMAGAESAPISGETPKAEEAEMHTKCCGECKTGLAKDRSGAAPDTVPCADFTDTLSPWCLEHFRAHPAMASSCP
jgi:hypothetical protein